MKTFLYFLIGLGTLAVICLIGNYFLGPVFAPCFIACYLAVALIENQKNV